MKEIFKVQKRSFNIALGFIAALLLLVIFDKFNIIKLIPYISEVIIIGGAIFVISEASMSVKKLTKEPLKIFGITIAVIALVGSILNILMITNDTLNIIQGIMSILLVIYVFIELFQ